MLTLAQALAACGTVMLVAFGGIAGARLAPTAALATLPWSLTVVGIASASLPAALLMQRIGRRPAFVGSAVLAAVSALFCAWSIAHQSFIGLCAAGFLLGTNSAFVQQYRFAAAELLDPSQAGRAVATVMLGTLAAAILAPALGEFTRDMQGWPEFTGSFVVLAGLLLAAAGTLATLRLPARTAAPTATASRSLPHIIAEPGYRLAVLAGIAAYASMSFVMTATPISMHLHDGFSSGDTSLVISVHLLGMYLPSLASGWLAAKLSARTMLLIGVAGMSSCVFISAVIGHTFTHYFAGLLLLGVGWNFMFVAATTLLTRSYRRDERFRAQGTNDLAIFGSQAIASLLAGSAIEHLGWAALNLSILPLLALVVWAALRSPGTTPTRSLSQSAL
jgi:MFS family permease